jgi:DNA polymerase-4
VIYTICRQVFNRTWHGRGIFQVQVTALIPQQGCEQLDLFLEHDEERDQANSVMDRVNDQYGEFTLMPARLLNRSEMPNVIAPSWKPSGHRKTI